MSFRLTITTPETTVFDSQAESMVAPGVTGSFGVLTNHAPMVSALRRGILKAMTENGTLFFLIGEGVTEIQRNVVSVLTDLAVRFDDALDAERALEEMKADMRVP